jgi:hypothetical protein
MKKFISPIYSFEGLGNGHRLKDLSMTEARMATMLVRIGQHSLYLTDG